MITVGHYQTKFSLGSDKPDIIRILGADKDRFDNWITQDGKSIPSYVIENDYVKLDVNSNENRIKSGLDKILADFQPVNIDHLIVEESVKEESISKNIPTKIQKEVHEIQKSSEYNFSSLLEKSSIDYINNKHQEKFGINKIFKKPILNIPIIINYDIEKLKNIIDIMDLDENDVINHLFSEIFDDLLENSVLIKSEIKSLLNTKYEEIKPEIVKSEEIKPEIVKSEEIKPEIKISNNELNNEILKTDELIQSFLNKYNS